MRTDTPWERQFDGRQPMCGADEVRRDSECDSPAGSEQDSRAGLRVAPQWTGSATASRGALGEVALPDEESRESNVTRWLDARGVHEPGASPSPVPRLRDTLSPSEGETDGVRTRRSHSRITPLNRQVGTRGSARPDHRVSSQGTAGRPRSGVPTSNRRFKGRGRDACRGSERVSRLAPIRRQTAPVWPTGNPAKGVRSGVRPRPGSP